MEPQTQSKGRDVYTIVTDSIIAHLENGVVPWKQPWKNAGIPQNLVTKRPYRGMNLWLLSMLGYEHNLFLTYKQVNNLNGRVKKNEKGHLVIFWHWKEVKDEESEELRKIPFLRYYLVFNVEQCSGVEHAVPHDGEAKVINPLVECERVLDKIPEKPSLRHKEQRAYYNPLKDFINMPRMNSFETSLGYYSTLFHELVHWTGHPSRLNRRELVQMAEFGSDPYSKEELTAELGAAFLMAYCGFQESIEQSAAYIEGWLKVLREDRRFIIYAAAKAQQAVDFILNVEVKEQVIGSKEEEQVADLPF